MNQKFPNSNTQECGAFTLIELMAVMVVIAMLAVLALGIVDYTNKKTARSQVLADFAMLDVAIESFKIDKAAYPTSSTLRITQRWGAERTNSWMLYTQLAPYLKPPARMLTTSLGITYFTDPWSGAYNYYCTYPRLPNPSYGHEGFDIYAQDYRSIGGQARILTYDLFSYGPDRKTYLPASGSYWNIATLAADDICNWK